MEEMVADQTPRVFAVVLEFGEHIDAQIVSWGMVIDEQNTYVATVDGKSQFLLTAPENALKYVRRLPGVTSHIVWAPHRR
ncbi:hypothetical protein ALI144C_48075 [Actinosynnema sp. ALI-1.44]|nr:hypothetical protein ALI144C_48075 [Actinosynnema sp. ALI-1.44]